LRLNEKLKIRKDFIKKGGETRYLTSSVQARAKDRVEIPFGFETRGLIHNKRSVVRTIDGSPKGH
jgi:hypothetical protein